MSERTFGVKIAANVDSYVAAMGRATAATASMSATSQANMKKLGGQMQNVGKDMTRMVTLPVVAVGAAAVKMSVDYDTAFSRMVGLAGVTAGEVDGLKKSVLELAGRTAQSPIALAEALYQASSSGLDTAQAMAAVERAAKAAAAGMGSAADIVSLVASATGAYGAANITAAEATDVLTASIKAGRADPDELAGSLGRILPISAQLGISFAEVGGATAFLSNTLGNTSETVTALQGFLSKLVSPTAQGRQALLDMGTSASELQSAIDANGLMGALELLRTHGFEGNAEAMRGLFDDIQGRTAALTLMSDASGTLASTLDQVTDSAGATNTAFDVASESSGFKMKHAWSEIQVALVTAGDIIVPIVSDIAGAIGHLAGVFADLPAPVQKLVVGFLAIAAIAGPIVVMAGTVLKNFTLIQSAMTKMGTSGSAMATTFGVVGAVAGVAMIGFAHNAQKAAANAETVADSFRAISEAADSQVLDEYNTAMFGAAAEAAAHGKTLADVSKQFVESNIEGARRVVAIAKETGVWSESLFSLEIAIGNADRAAGNAASTNAEFGGSADDAAGSVDDLGVAAEETAAKVFELIDPLSRQGEAARDGSGENKDWADAVEIATNALNDQITALEADLAAQMAFVDFARGLADAQYALADSTDGYNRFLEEMPGKVAEINKSSDSQAEKQRKIGELYRDGAKAAVDMADDTVAAYQQAAGGTLTATQQLDIWNAQALANASTAAGPLRQSILDYIATTNDIDPNVITYISALIDQGRLDEANALLTEVSGPRDAAVLADADQASLNETQADIDAVADGNTATVLVNANTSPAEAQVQAMMARWRNAVANVVIPGGPTQKTASTNAEGGYIGGPMLSTLGEGGLPEVVLPLTKPGRINALMSDQRVSGPIFKALGMVQSAEGRTINISHSTTPATSSSAATVGGAVMSATLPSNDDEVMARKFERGLITAQEYGRYIEQQAATEDELTDRGMQLFRESQRLKRDEIAATEAAEKAAADTRKAQDDATKKAMEDEQALRDAAVVREDARMKWLYDHQQISYGQYIEYLGGKLAGEETFSRGWIAIHSQMDQLREAETAKVRQAAEDDRKFQQDQLAATFDQWRLQMHLSDAIRDQAKSYDDLQAAATKVWVTAQTGEGDLGAAQSAYDSARSRAASDVIEGADARANALGLRDDTREWVSFMRNEIGSFIPGHPDVADALSAYLAGLPAFASGGYVGPTPGGAIVRVAEAGQGEYMVPADRMRSMMSMAGGGGTVVHTYQFSIDAPPTYDRSRAGRDLMELVNDALRQNGQPPIGGR